MGNLSNLYVSQSYQSLIHLATNNTASDTLIELQDGLGNGLEISVNTSGDISASGELSTRDLRIEGETHITGGVDINTFFTSSTEAYLNQTDPYFTETIKVIGSYSAAGGLPPTINDVKVGWLCNGQSVDNGIVTAVSGSGTGDVLVTVGGEYPQIGHTYSFSGVVTNPVRITGSLEINGDAYVTGTIHAYEIITTIESASVILSSGSNVIGDEITDTQTIVGQTTISGSLILTGNQINIGDLFVTNEISSSTINGLGNATLYSQSVDLSINSLSQSFDGTITNLSASIDSRLDYLEGPFSASVDFRLDQLETDTGSQDQRLDSLEAFTSSQDNINSGYNAFTQSTDQRLNSIEEFTSSLVTDFVTDVEYSASIAVVTGSLITQIDTKLDSASFDNWTGSVFTPFSSSVDSRINTTNSNLTALSSSVAVTAAAQQFEINTLSSYTGSYATTGSNTFIGSNTFSGSVNGQVIPLTITSLTASMDCSQGNFFTLTLPIGSTQLQASNIISGETITLRTIQPSAGYGQLTVNNTIKTPFNTPIALTNQIDAEDILTFVSFDNVALYGVSTLNFV